MFPADTWIRTQGHTSSVSPPVVLLLALSHSALLLLQGLELKLLLAPPRLWSFLS